MAEPRIGVESVTFAGVVNEAFVEEILRRLSRRVGQYVEITIRKAKG